MEEILPGVAPMGDLLDAVNRHPLHRLLPFTMTEAADGVARGTLEVTASSANLGGVLHGGALYLALDTAAAFAAVSSLEPGGNATTHDINVSVLRPTPLGSVVDVEARVIRAGRRLVFVHAEATAGGGLVAVARVTKSVVPAPAD